MTIDLLFDEFAARYARGERPDVEDYLVRAGAEQEELGLLIDRYLQATPAREPAEEELVLLDARLEHEPPLMALRLRRRQRVDDVVDALVSALGLDASRRAKVKRYYQELETGLLDPAGVSERVWAVLGEGARGLAAWRPAPPLVEETFLRADALGPVRSFEVLAAAPEQPDEVDLLFQSGEN